MNTISNIYPNLAIQTQIFYDLHKLSRPDPIKTDHGRDWDPISQKKLFLLFFYSNSFVNVRVSVISTLALIFQIRFPKRRGLLNGVVFLNHLQFHGLYLKEIK